MDHTGHGPSYWRTLDTHPSLTLLQSEISAPKKRLHGRQRTELRLLINHAVAKRERAIEMGKFNGHLRSILGERRPFVDLDTLQLDQHTLLTNAMEVHHQITAHFQQWYCTPEDQHPLSIHHPSFNWRTLGESKDNFLTAIAHLNIPPEQSDNVDLLWQSISHTNLPSSHKLATVSKELKDTLKEPPTFLEFFNALNSKKQVSAGGPSTCTYKIMRSWPPEYLRAAYQNLVLLWPHKFTPMWWKFQWLCPIPKVSAEVQTLNSLRPIMLIEVMRKIWTGISLRKIQNGWAHHTMLNSGQAGFQANCDTSSCILQVMNLLDHQNYDSNGPIYGPS